MFTQIPVIACRAMLNTARDSTRFVARLALSAVIGREKRSWRPRLPACPFGAGSGVPSAFHLFSCQGSRGTIFAPSLLLARKTAFSEPKRKNIFLFVCRWSLSLTSTGKKIGVSTTKTEKIILLFCVSLFHVFPLTVVIFVLPYFFSPRLEYIFVLYSGGVPSTSQHLCRNFFCDNEDHLRSDGHQMFQPERP